MHVFGVRLRGMELSVEELTDMNLRVGAWGLSANLNPISHFS